MFTKISLRIVVLLTVAFLLVGCGTSGNAAQDLMNLYASANSGGSQPASHASIQFSPRNNCDTSATIQLLARINANLKAWDATELDLSADEWLDQQMGDFSCILAQEGK